MARRVALSPSTQTWNAYTVGNTNEQEQAYRQAEACAKVLRLHGVEAVVMTRGKNDPSAGFVSNAKESNATGPYDAHVCFHTDAGGATGTTAFHYPTSSNGRRLAQAIYNELAPLSPGADHGVRARGDLYELKSTIAVAALIEAAPHDIRSSSQWIVDNSEAIGAAYARGILNYLGLQFVPLAAPSPVATPVVSTPSAPALTAPPFPLGVGKYFGPRYPLTNVNSVSGYYSHRSSLQKWQQRMKDRGWNIVVDGRYGPNTAQVALAFQKDKNLYQDALIGPETWRAAWESPVT